MLRTLRNINGFLIGVALVALLALGMEIADAQTITGEPAEYRGFIESSTKKVCIYRGNITGRIYTANVEPGTSCIPEPPKPAPTHSTSGSAVA